MKKKLTLSLLASLAVHTAVLVPMLTFQTTHCFIGVNSFTSTESTSSDSCGEHKYDPTEHDEPHEKAIDKIFCYAKKALKMIVGAALAAATAFKLFHTYWK